MTNRLQAMGTPKYKDGFNTVVMHESELQKPYRWKKKATVFVNSMSDFFHKDVSLDFQKRMLKVMADNERHTFQILTKRPELISSDLKFSKNIWLGVSVESDKFYQRIKLLETIDVNIRFLSCEPLLSNLPSLPLNNISWVIVGGESGPKARRMYKDWVLDIQDQCQIANVPFFFKQWGGYGEDGIKRNKKKNGRELNGMIYNGMPC